MSDYIVNFSEKRGLWVYRDELWNVIVKKPASEGYKNSPPVMLQAHTDMVCVKTAESSHDFTSDPIQLCLEGNILHAKDTSLGADDGYGVAFMLAILDDDKIEHPPLECVFTTQEETTNEGAKFIDVSILSAKRMIGLDADQEYSTFVSCFCSDRLVLKKKLEQSEAEGRCYEIKIDKMEGNTLQGVVHQECGNAIKVMIRLLKAITYRYPMDVRLYGLSGGTGENFTPLECSVEFLCNGGGLKAISDIVNKEFSTMLSEYNDESFKGRVAVTECPPKTRAVNAEDTLSVIDALYLLPNNMFHAGASDKELISINNIGIIKLEESEIEITASCRSKYSSSENELIEHCRIIAEAYGFAFETAVRYSPWPYNSGSEMRKLANEVMGEYYGRTLEEVVCPGGLEIALLIEKIEGLDAFELGVQTENPHSVKEFMDLDSFHRVYKVLLEMLKRMK